MATTKITTPELFDLSTVNTALRLPNGSTATRPTSASQGEWRFNTDLKYVEFYDGGEWRQIDTELTCTTNTVDYPTTNLAYYKLDSSAADQTTNNYDGTANDITFYNGQQYSQGAVFNGNSGNTGTSYINTGLTWPGGTEISWSGWIKTPGGINQYLVGDFDSLGTNLSQRFAIQFHNTDVLFIGTSNGVAETFNNLGSISAYLDKWTHVAVTVNGTTVTAYLDGSLFGTATGTALSAGANPFAIGAYTAAVNSQSVQGVMDQVRFFSTELTASQVTELYKEVQCPCTTDNNDNPTTNVAYYKLDGNANDATNTYNGTWFGTEAYAYGPYGVSAVFNGSTSYIDTQFNQDVSTAFTWSLWFNSDVSDTSYRLLIDKTNPNPSYPGAGIALQAGNVYGMINGTGTSLTYTGNSYNINQWYHVALTSNGSTVKLYLNSVEVGTGSVSTINTSQNILIGDSVTWTTNYDGAIDQVRIFSSALSATQITSLYDEVYCNTVSKLNIFNEGTSSCLALYEFEDNADSTESSSYDGTWFGTEAYGGGQYKKAGIFNGSTSKIVLPTLSSDFVGANSRSVSAWVRITSTPSASLCIFNSGDAATLEAFGYFIGTSRQIIISYYNKNWSTSEIISLNTWNHIVFTYNGGAVETSSNSAVYINGTLATLGSATGSATGSANTSNTNHAIGVFNATSALFFDGSIDQVRLFNKELTATEVLQVYTE